MLTQERLKELLVYDPETGRFTWLPRPVRCKQDATWNSAWAGGEAGTPKDGYVQICLDYKVHRAHRLAFLYMRGKIPKGDIDHINRNRADNRWANLREATRSQNLVNGRHKHTDRGVRQLPGGRWQARIWRKGQDYNLGTFGTKKEALAAYRSAAKETYGDFAKFD